MVKLKKYKKAIWTNLVLILAFLVHILIPEREDAGKSRIDMKSIPDAPVMVLAPKQKQISISVSGRIEAQHELDIYKRWTDETIEFECHRNDTNSLQLSSLINFAKSKNVLLQSERNIN